MPFRAFLGLGVTMDHPLRFVSASVTVLAVLADVSARRLERRILVPALAWTAKPSVHSFWSSSSRSPRMCGR